MSTDTNSGYVWMWRGSPAGYARQDAVPARTAPTRFSRTDVALRVSCRDEGILVADMFFGRRQGAMRLSAIPHSLSRIDADFDMLNRRMHQQEVSLHERDWSGMPVSPIFSLSEMGDAKGVAEYVRTGCSLGVLGLTPYHGERLTLEVAEAALDSGLQPSQVHAFGQSGWSSLVASQNWVVLDWLLSETEQCPPSDAVAYAALCGVPDSLMSRFIERATGIPDGLSEEELYQGARTALVQRCGNSGWSAMQRDILLHGAVGPHAGEPMLLDAVASVRPDLIRDVPEGVRLSSSSEPHPAQTVARYIGVDEAIRLASEGAIRSIDASVMIGIASEAARNGDIVGLKTVLSRGYGGLEKLVEDYPPAPAAVLPILGVVRGKAGSSNVRLSYLHMWLAAVDIEDTELRRDIVEGVDLDVDPIRWCRMPGWFICGVLARHHEERRPGVVAGWIRAMIFEAGQRGLSLRESSVLEEVLRLWPVPPVGKVLAACQRPCFPTAWTRLLLDVGVDCEQEEERWCPDDDEDDDFSVSALGMACYYGRIENAVMLLRAGADPSRDVDRGRSVTQLANLDSVAERTLATAQRLVRGEG